MLNNNAKSFYTMGNQQLQIDNGYYLKFIDHYVELRKARSAVVPNYGYKI